MVGSDRVVRPDAVQLCVFFIDIPMVFVLPSGEYWVPIERTVLELRSWGFCGEECHRSVGRSFFKYKYIIQLHTKYKYIIHFSKIQIHGSEFKVFVSIFQNLEEIMIQNRK